MLFLYPFLKGGEELQRFDTVEIRAVKTDEGFIRDAPVIGRAGILRYKNADGSERIEYRPPDEAFAADSLAGIRAWSLRTMQDRFSLSVRY